MPRAKKSGISGKRTCRISANENAAFVSDERLKVSGFTYNSYPYTVAFEEEMEIASTYYIPGWEPSHGERMSLQLSRYILSTTPPTTSSGRK